jgi:hypothetical protein
MTIADKVLTSLTSPDGKSLAAVTVDAGQPSLAVGAANGPLTALGPVSFTYLGTDTFYWGGSRVYVTDRPPTAIGGTALIGGILYTGSPGTAGLTKLGRDVVFVGPNASGSAATVVTVDSKAGGGVAGFALSRYSSM